MSAEHLITRRITMPRLFHAREKNDFFPRTFHSDVPCFQFICGGRNQLELHEWNSKHYRAFFPPWPQTPVAHSHMTRKNICHLQKTAYLAPCLQPPVKSSITVILQRADFLNAVFWCVELTWKIWSECYEWINNMNDMNLQPPPDLWEEIILVVRSSILLILLLHFFKQTKENNIKLGQQCSDVVEYLLWWRYWFWGLSSQGRTCHEFTDRPKTQITVRKHWAP